jgi:hypothetical protein
MINAEQANTDSTGGKLEQPIECSKYFINDILACSMTYSGLNPDADQVKLLLVYLVDNKGIEYTLYLGATPDLFEYFKPVFDHMVSSFELKGIR